MIHKLEVDEVDSIEERFDGAYPNVITIGFAKVTDADAHLFSNYFLLKRCVEEEPDGDDEIYIEWCDQIYGGYGGLKSFALSRNLARIEFEKDAEFFDEFEDADKFDALEISFDIDSEQYELISNQLKNVIFRDYESLLEIKK